MQGLPLISETLPGVPIVASLRRRDTDVGGGRLQLPQQIIRLCGFEQSDRHLLGHPPALVCNENLKYSEHLGRQWETQASFRCHRGNDNDWSPARIGGFSFRVAENGADFS